MKSKLPLLILAASLSLNTSEAFELPDFSKMKSDIQKNVKAAIAPVEEALMKAAQQAATIQADVENKIENKQPDCIPVLAQTPPAETESETNIAIQETPETVTPPVLTEEKPETVTPVLTPEPKVVIEESQKPAPQLPPAVEVNNSLPERDAPRTFSTKANHSCKGDSVVSKVCTKRGVSDKFIILNEGPNSVITSDDPSINRTFEFEFPDRARSDMRLMISDAPDGRTSRVTYSALMFFPRDVLPTTKKVGDVIELTLPNKEVVKFDAKTKEIIGGVLSEGPLTRAPGGKANPASIRYTGDNVLIRADKTGDLPYGDIEVKGKNAPSITTATISKKGFKDCRVPSKDIWETNYAAGDVQIKPELQSDTGLSKFIQKRCGFSL